MLPISLLGICLIVVSFTFWCRLFSPNERITFSTSCIIVVFVKIASTWLKLAPGKLSICRSGMWTSGILGKFHSPIISHFFQAHNVQFFLLVEICLIGHVILGCVAIGVSGVPSCVGRMASILSRVGIRLGLGSWINTCLSNPSCVGFSYFNASGGAHHGFMLYSAPLLYWH